MGNSIEVTEVTIVPTNQGTTGSGGEQTFGQQGTTGNSGAQSQSFVDKAKTNAQDRARSAVESGKTQAVGVVGGLARSLNSASQDLRNQQSPAASIVQQAAERLESVTRYLETTEPDQLLRRTESWAKQNPALFIGAAFIAGIVGARFLKSSPPSTAQNFGGDGAGSGAFSDREIARPASVESI